MDDKDGLGADHQDSDLSLLDSGQELHVDQLALLSDDVLLAKSHEFSQLPVLNVIVHGFGALDLEVVGEVVSSLELPLIFNNDPPDALSGGSSVLLQDSFPEGESFGETFFETIDVIVSIGVGGDETSLVELDQGGLGSEADHGVGVAHAVKSSSGKLPHGVEEALLVVGEGAWVDPANVGAVFVDDLLVDLVGLLVFELHDLAVPALFLNLFEDGDCVLAVAVGSFVRPSDRLEDADGSPLLYLLTSNTGAHSQ